MRSEGDHDLIRHDEAFRFDVIELGTPAPREVAPTARSLPTPASSLVGREHELADVCALLGRDDVRLLTLTGPGGTGKTRLALAAAQALQGEFRDGATFVGLASVTDAELVPSSIARALGITETSGEDLVQTLGKELRAAELLLLLDNFERLLAAAPLTVELLEAAPGLTLLTTSRATLNVSGEHEYPVPLLALPDLERRPSLKALSQYDAVALFIDRAAAVKPGFEVTSENAPAVAEICVRLDGLPLAIELAAARLKLLSPQALLARLGQRLPLLTGGPRDVPAHQQTLRGTLDWSHSLLDAGEQQLFARIAVFAGGATLEMVEAVCDQDNDLPGELLGLVSSLLDKSLIGQTVGGNGAERCAMLATVREYALERLEASGEGEELRRRHAEYFLALAEEAQPRLTGPEQGTWMERLEVEHDNLRAALTWTRDTGEAVLLGRLAAALWRFWTVRGHQSEGRSWLLEALTMSHGLPLELRAKILWAAGVLTQQQGDPEGARQMHEEQLALCRELRDPIGTGRALTGLAQVAEFKGDFDQAQRLLEESLTLFRQADEKAPVATTIGNLGYGALCQGDLKRASRLCGQSLDLYRELQDADGESHSLENLGFAAIAQGRYDEGLQFLEESLKICERIRRNDGVAYFLEGVAHVAVARGNAERATRLLGAVEAWVERTRGRLEPFELELHTSTISRARAELGLEKLEEARAEGRALTLEEAVALVSNAEENGSFAALRLR